MLDVYAFFNSEDVKDHCRKLNCIFTGRETAYIIWSSNRHTLHQKISAWEELLQTFPDEQHADFTNQNCSGLHQFLRNYIDRLRRFLTEFESNNGQNVYSYKKLYEVAPDRYLDESVLFSSYETCIATAAEEAVENHGIRAFLVQKRTIKDSCSERVEIPSICLTSQVQPMQIGVVPYCGGEDLLVPPFGFYGMWVDIPTPFKRGDIVCGIDAWGQKCGPVVVDTIPTSGEDYIDMCADVFELDFWGRVCRSEDYCPFSFEYYRGPLVGQDRLLFAIRNHLNGSLPLEELLRSHSVHTLEFLAKKRIGIMGWEENFEHLAGLAADAVTIN